VQEVQDDDVACNQRAGEDGVLVLARCHLEREHGLVLQVHQSLAGRGRVQRLQLGCARGGMGGTSL
jgi:hypothetical protein